MIELLLRSEMKSNGMLWQKVIIIVLFSNRQVFALNNEPGRVQIEFKQFSVLDRNIVVVSSINVTSTLKRRKKFDGSLWRDRRRNPTLYADGDQFWLDIIMNTRRRTPTDLVFWDCGRSSATKTDRTEPGRAFARFSTLSSALKKKTVLRWSNVSRSSSLWHSNRRRPSE